MKRLSAVVTHWLRSRDEYVAACGAKGTDLLYDSCPAASWVRCKKCLKIFEKEREKG